MKTLKIGDTLQLTESVNLFIDNIIVNINEVGYIELSFACTETGGKRVNYSVSQMEDAIKKDAFFVCMEKCFGMENFID